MYQRIIVPGAVRSNSQRIMYLFCSWFLVDKNFGFCLLFGGSDGAMLPVLVPEERGFVCVFYPGFCDNHFALFFGHGCSVHA